MVRSNLNLLKLQTKRNQKFVDSASNTKIIVEGHTDNAGDSAKNIGVVQKSTGAIGLTWLKASDESRININDQRIITVDGYGSLNWIAGTTTTQSNEERAKNRRVTIILK